MTMLATFLSRIGAVVGRIRKGGSAVLQRKPELNFALASLYVERTGKVVDYSIWFSHEAVEVLEQDPAALATSFVDHVTIGDVLDGKWVRRTCESKHDAINFDRRLRQRCYPALISLLSLPSR